MLVVSLPSSGGSVPEMRAESRYLSVEATPLKGHRAGGSLPRTTAPLPSSPRTAAAGAHAL